MHSGKDAWQALDQTALPAGARQNRRAMAARSGTLRALPSEQLAARKPLIEREGRADHMNDNVTSFPPRPNLANPPSLVPDQDVIKRLEELLGEAKRGWLCGIAVAGVLADRGILTTWASNTSGTTAPLLGACALLLHQFAAHYDDAPGEYPKNDDAG